MSLLIKSAVIAMALTLSATSSFATKVSISGTHGKTEIKSTCKRIGGTYYSKSTGDYGCISKEHGTSVKCGADGKCTGSVPQ